MPNKDGTGPNGNGSKTGRQLGNCEGTEPIVRGNGNGNRNGCNGRRGNGRRCN